MHACAPRPHPGYGTNEQRNNNERQKTIDGRCGCDAGCYKTGCGTCCCGVSGRRGRTLAFPRQNGLAKRRTQGKATQTKNCHGRRACVARGRKEERTDRECRAHAYTPVDRSLAIQSRVLRFTQRGALRNDDPCWFRSEACSCRSSRNRQRGGSGSTHPPHKHTHAHKF